MSDVTDTTLPSGSQVRELIKDSHGQLVAEILSDGDQFVLFKRRKPTFPPTPRTEVIGVYESLEQAKAAAAQLLSTN